MTCLVFPADTGEQALGTHHRHGLVALQTRQTWIIIADSVAALVPAEMKARWGGPSTVGVQARFDSQALRTDHQVNIKERPTA